jgi:hypothetical protein
MGLYISKVKGRPKSKSLAGNSVCHMSLELLFIIHSIGRMLWSLLFAGNPVFDIQIRSTCSVGDERKYLYRLALLFI